MKQNKIHADINSILDYLPTSADKMNDDMLELSIQIADEAIKEPDW